MITKAGRMINGGRVDKLEQLLLEQGATLEAIDMCLRSFIGHSQFPLAERDDTRNTLAQASPREAR